MLKVVFFLRNRVKFKAIYPGKINGVFLQTGKDEREAVIAIFVKYLARYYFAGRRIASLIRAHNAF